MRKGGIIDVFEQYIDILRRWAIVNLRQHEGAADHQHTDGRLHTEALQLLSERGQRILGYRESMGGDHRWHAQVVLADGSRVYLNESD